MDRTHYDKAIRYAADTYYGYALNLIYAGVQLAKDGHLECIENAAAYAIRVDVLEDCISTTFNKKKSVVIKDIIRQLRSEHPDTYKRLFAKRR